VDHKLRRGISSVRGAIVASALHSGTQVISMPLLTTDQGGVHYEVYGRGRPVILLHGYQGSWGLWQQTMASLGASYRLYALDFWGFGESGARRSTYAVKDFVVLVDQFMEQLGIGCAPLVGHSMGGTVSLLVAIQYPQRAQKAVVIGSPIVGSSLFFFPMVFGFRPIGWITYRNLWIYKMFYRALAPLYSKDPNWAEFMDRDVSRTTLEAFFASIGSLRQTDLRSSLPRIGVPVMGMYGAKDIIVDPNQWKALQQGLSRARIERFADAGHFIMLDQPDEFQGKLKEFLDAE
jgi:pimeloyl-ACP methyl ester carboxylesterase